MSNPNLKRGSRASVLISYALAQQVSNALSTSQGAPGPEGATGAAKALFKTAASGQTDATQHAPASSIATAEGTGEGVAPALAASGAQEGQRSSIALPQAPGEQAIAQASAGAPPVQDLRPNQVRRNDAFSQQVLSRLNHRIKQQKRSEKRVDTACSRVAKTLYKVTRPLKYLALLQLVLVPFFTKPAWCVAKWGPEAPEYELCGYNPDFAGAANAAAAAGAEGDEAEDYRYVGYPSSQIPKLHPHTQAAVDATSYALLLYFTGIRLCLKKVTKTARLRCAGMTSLLLYLIVANVLAITANAPRTAPQQLVSFLILMFFIRSLRESWKRIFLVVWHSLAIMVIILAYLLFCSLIAYTLYANPIYVDPEGYFQDIPVTIFNIYVLFTTSNFPDILFPFWKVDNWAGVFFVGFLLVGLYMLLNLMLAVFYNSYKAQVERKIAKYDSLREEFLRKEFRAAGAGPERDHISTAEFRAKYGAKVVGQSEKV